MASFEDRFWAKVDRSGPLPTWAPFLGPCWLWTGAKSEGYGQIKAPDRVRFSHRVSYEMHVGPIPDGMVLDHLCRVRHCINPDHLEPVTHRDNILRSPNGPSAVNARKTHCPAGHALDGDNVVTNRRGNRECRICKVRRRRVAA